MFHTLIQLIEIKLISELMLLKKKLNTINHK